MSARMLSLFSCLSFSLALSHILCALFPFVSLSSNSPSPKLNRSSLSNQPPLTFPPPTPQPQSGSLAAQAKALYNCWLAADLRESAPPEARIQLSGEVDGKATLTADVHLQVRPLALTPVPPRRAVTISALVAVQN